MNPSVCVTTFVFGSKYQGYIPFLMYSLLKSYPEYVPIVFVHGKLKEDIHQQLEWLRTMGRFVIKDHVFPEFKTLNTFEGKALRWLLQDDLLLAYDYIYFVDIDIIYINEDPPLHVQHIEHMQRLNLPFSNTSRLKINRNRELKTFSRRIKNYGIRNAVKHFIRGNQTEKRLTGLHFIKTKTYLPAVKPYQENYQQWLLSKKYLSRFQGFDDEPLLYQLCLDAGMPLDHVGEHDETSICYKNYKTLSFRPHHGIHLGLFRGEEPVKNSHVLRSSTYEYYVSVFLNYLKDPLFIRLLTDAAPFIKKQFASLLDFYNIPFDLDKVKSSSYTQSMDD